MPVACVIGLMVSFYLTAPRILAAEADLTPVIDLHVDISYRSLYKHQPFAVGSGQFRAADLLPAGLRGVVLPLYVPQDAEPGGRSRLQLEKSYAHVFRSIVQTPPYSLPGCSIRRAGAARRQVATWLAFEGSGPIGPDLSELRRWALRGVRSFGLVHSVPNQLSSSSGRADQGGLTLQGREFVRQVAMVKGVIDVSHASWTATSEVIALSRELGRPVMATHSNAFTLAPHARNLSDEHIVGIARSGGVIGVNFHRSFLRKSARVDASIDDVVEQILYLRRLGGPTVAAIGSDFEGGIRAVPELADASKFQRLFSALRDAGLSRAEVESVFFRNALRVLCPRPIDQHAFPRK